MKAIFNFFSMQWTGLYEMLSFEGLAQTSLMLIDKFGEFGEDDDISTIVYDR